MSNRDTLSRRSFLKRAAAAPVVTSGVGWGGDAESDAGRYGRDDESTTGGHRFSEIHDEYTRLFFPWENPFVRDRPYVALVAPAKVAQVGPLEELSTEIEQVFALELAPLLGQIDRMAICDRFVGCSGSFDRDAVVDALLPDDAEPPMEIGSFKVLWSKGVAVGVGPGVLFEASGPSSFDNGDLVGQAVGYYQSATTLPYSPVFTRLFEEVTPKLATTISTDPWFESRYQMLSRFSENITGIAHDITQEGDAIRNRAFVLFDDAAAGRKQRVREVLTDVSRFHFQQYDSPMVEFDGELVTMSEVRPAAEATIYSSGI